MALKSYKPITPGRRWMQIVDRKDITENKRLVAAEQREKERFHDLLQIVIPVAAALSEERDPGGLLEKIVLNAMAICDADGGTLFLRTDDDLLEFAIMRIESLRVARGGTTGVPIDWLEDAGHVNTDAGYGPWPAVEAWAIREPGSPPAALV